MQDAQVAKKKKGAGKEGQEGGEGGTAACHTLNWTVQLLANCRKDELEPLEKLQGVPRCVAMYRSVSRGDSHARSKYCG